MNIPLFYINILILCIPTKISIVLAMCKKYYYNTIRAKTLTSSTASEKLSRHKIDISISLKNINEKEVII